MSKSRIVRNVILAIMVAGIGSAAVLAQPPDKSKPSQDVRDKPINVKKESKDVYKKWLENDVPYLITDEEKKAFKALTTDEERENFIENFWRRRDPNPDTEENEYREEYYERIATRTNILRPAFPDGKQTADAYTSLGVNRTVLSRTPR